MTRTIDNTDDVIDSRDIIARIEELTEECENGVDDDGDTVYTPRDALPEGHEQALDADEKAELAALRKLASQGEDYAADWEHGEALIRETYFKQYAMELADDLGIEAPTQWPYTCIDWDQAARELQHDYTAIDFDGVTYYVR